MHKQARSQAAAQRRSHTESGNNKKMVDDDKWCLFSERASTSPTHSGIHNKWIHNTVLIFLWGLQNWQPGATRCCNGTVTLTKLYNPASEQQKHLHHVFMAKSENWTWSSWHLQPQANPNSACLCLAAGLLSASESGGVGAASSLLPPSCMSLSCDIKAKVWFCWFVYPQLAFMPSVTKNCPSGRDDGSWEERRWRGGGEEDLNELSFAGKWKWLVWLSGRCFVVFVCLLVEISLQPRSKLMNMFS